MCYIFDSFVYNKVRTRKRVFVLSDGNNFSLGRKHFSSWEEIAFLRDAFGMGLFWTGKSKGLVLPFKRTRFTLQKDSFWTAKGLVLKGKRSPFLSVEW